VTDAAAPRSGKADPLIRDITDTARWVATYRARETERADPLFVDLYAKRLAGERGEQIAAAIPNISGTDWPYVLRTHLVDRYIAAEVDRGIDTVVNLAAGLDARPYRMTLPPSLTWIEVDLPDLLAYKTQVLSADRPRCILERVPIDLSDAALRQSLFERIASRARKTLVVSEGLLIYLDAAQVAALARDLAAHPPFERWIVDIASPGLLHMLQKRMSDLVTRAGAPFKFAPAEGPAFFEPHGWKALDVESIFDAARAAGRLPFFLRLMSLLPQPKGPRRIWSGVCLLGRAHAGGPR
jgi:methyltransferase (TIGR00027 family)